MKVNSVNPSYFVLNLRRMKEATNPIAQEPVPVTTPSSLSFITFRAGNKEQALMIGVEVPPYNKSGGVATVMQDFRALRVKDSDPEVTNAMKNSFEFYKQNNKVLVDPVYNGFISYGDRGFINSVDVPTVPRGLPADHPLKKYEGMYFQTTNTNLRKYATVEDFFKNEKLEVANINGKGVKGNVFLLEQIGDKRVLDFGGLGDSETRLFRVQLEVDGKLRKTNDFKVYTDLTASLVSPYEKGGYSTVPGKVNQTWKGVADAKAMKAIVEYMPDICEEVSKDGVKFDPATIVLNDSQTGYASEFIGQKAAKGQEFWQGKKAVFIGHNLGDGYVQRTSYMNMFMNIADKDLRNAVYNDEGFTIAAKEGAEEVERYFKKLLPKECLDLQEQVSPFKNTVYWAQRGLVSKIIPVSEMYAYTLANDPEFAPSVQKYLKELSEQGVFEGNLNAFENVEFDPTSKQGPPGYYSKTFDVNVAGKNVKIEPLSVFEADKIKPGEVDLKYVREVKRQNKLKILQRFDKDFLKALQKEGSEKTFNEVVLGLANKEAGVYGYIRKDIIEEASKANSRVKMISGWGRMDAQKAMDSAMRAFIDYIKGNPSDKHSVLFIGGPNSSESEKCINLIKQYANDKDVAGRMVFIDGFLPNKPFASASDFTVFPSRFAPCELTDLESTKMFSSPIVTNLQGLGQKNFDASFEGELEKVTGYKTKHAYTIHLNELKAELTEEENKALDKAVKKFRNSIKDGIRGKEVTEAMIDEMILKDGTLNWKYNFEVLRPFRDKMVERELSGLYKRALIDDVGKPVQDQMIQNLRKMKTDWENNGALKRDGISSAQKYRAAFRTDAKPVKEEDTLLYKLRDNCKEILDRYKNKGEGKAEVSFTGGVKDFFGSKGGKWTIGIVALAALAGIGYKFFKKPTNADAVVNSEPNTTSVEPAKMQAKMNDSVDAKPEKKEEVKHLSAVV